MPSRAPPSRAAMMVVSGETSTVFFITRGTST
jgi:hypothetical protein